MRRAVLICLLLLAGCATSPPAPPASAQLLIVTVANNGEAPMPPRGYHRPGYRISEAAATALAGLEHDYDLKQVDGWPIDLLGVYCAVMAVDTASGVDTTLARISSDARVQLAQPMQSFSVRMGYNDPYLNLQYGANVVQLQQMQQRASGHGVRVAVIDTGLDRTHPDLKGRIGTARNFVSGDDRFDSDVHGTAVAGIIAANANNGVGIVGMAPRAELLALKACWQDAANAVDAQCSTFTLAKALTFAVEQHVALINLSLGGPHDPLLTLLVELALARDIVVVAAEDSADEFPADVAGVIAVRAASNDPAPAMDHVVLEVAAQELLSTTPGGHYDYFSGSSMAAARVTGIAALLRQEHTDTSLAQLRSDLDERLTTLGVRGPDSDGRLVMHAPNPAPGKLPDRPESSTPTSLIDGT